MRKISEIIVHCSSTAELRDFGAKDIDLWHKAQGWDCIGYHYVVRIDGTIEEGRPVERIGAHCKGHNAYSIGVCYVGGLASDGKTPKDTRTPEQKAALLSLIRRLKSNYHGATVYGHCDFAKKACPCFDAREEYKNI